MTTDIGASMAQPHHDSHDTRPRRPAHRRRHRRRRAAAQAPARRTARSRRARQRWPTATARWCAIIVATVLRRLGTLRHLLAGFLERGLPPHAPRVETALLIGAAQILFLDVPDHAAVDLSVRLAQADRHAAHYAGAGQRGAAPGRARGRGAARHARRRRARHAGMAAGALERALRRGHRARDRRRQRPRAGARSHGEGRCRSNGRERLDGRVLPTGTVRIARARPGRRCCRASTRAPGGCRTPPPRCRRGCSATCAGMTRRRPLRRAGRQDRATGRRRRARHRGRSLARSGSPGCGENLARLALEAEIVAADAHAVAGRAVRRRAARCALLVDRHHPPPSRHSLAQERDRPRRARPRCRRGCSTARSTLLKPGGTLVYCTCSLEPEEGEQARSPRCWRAIPTCAAGRSRPARSAGSPNCICRDGDLRTLPCHLPDPDPRMAGLDGFFAARLDQKLEAVSRQFRLAAVATLRYMMRPGTAGAVAQPPSEKRRTRPWPGFRWRNAPGSPCSSARRAVRNVAGRAARPSADPLALRAGQDRPAADRAAGSAHRRPHPRQRDLCRPLRLRRQGRDLRRPLAVRDRRRRPTNGRRSLLGFGWLRHLRAAESGHHPRQCPRAGRRLDHPAGLVASGRLAARHPGAPHHLPGSARRR